MNGRAFLKNILLFIMIIISCFFIFITSQDLSGIGTRPIFIPITISFNALLLEKRKHQKKFFKISLIFLSILNLSWFLFHIYELISYYIQYNYLELDITYLYLIIIFTIFFTSLLDLKRETNSLNDIFMIITTIIIIIVHYRYYIDKTFLHNIIGNPSDPIVLQSRYHYISQYYLYFIFMYLILFIQKKVNSIPTKTSSSSNH